MNSTGRYLWSIALALLILGSTTAVSGCGSDGEASGNGQPLTKAQLMGKAEAICRQAVAEREKALSAGLRSGKTLQEASSAEVRRFVEAVLIEPLSQMNARLSQLHAVKGTEAISPMVRNYEKALKELEAHPQSVLRRDPFVKAHEAAAVSGLKPCNF